MQVGFHYLSHFQYFSWVNLSIVKLKLLRKKVAITEFYTELYMDKKQALIATTATIAFISGASFIAKRSEAHMDKKSPTTEMCAGVVRTGMNDCSANGHSCAGMAKKDNDPNEWVTLPKGTCKKLAKGRVIG